jgi:amino acid adenylation domain-containing protein
VRNPDWSAHEALHYVHDASSHEASARLVHELFEEQVGRTPDHLAVSYRDRHLTFSELDESANRLAALLRKEGVGPEELVALCLERSIEMVIAILATWKAGGAYAPLDPAYPPERLEYMLRDAAPRVLLTQPGLRDVLPATDAHIVVFGECAQAERVGPTSLVHEERYPISSAAENGPLAYVIYTSGSTGQPKGVMIEHEHAVHLWRGLEELYGGPDECQRIALNASLSFDASVQQIVQLLSGRSLCIVPQEVRLDAPRLLRFIDENQIDGIDCTPSQLKSWVAAGLLESRRHPRVVLVGGEAIDPDLWSALSRCTAIRFFNVYGPTECTVDSTCAALNGDVGPPHIGRPMLGRHIFILDEDGRPVARDAVGEIHIGGAGIGRGYLRRPQLTAERFIPDRFGARPDARLYKTGDLGRWRADGMIEYLGRNDHQVKIRGHRIELGEIEAQLTRHPHVKSAAVMAREDIPGEKRLVAYVIDEGAADSSVEELRAHLKSVLPDYMVPSAFVRLKTFPLTPSGKLDRRALPAPDLSAYSTREYEPPQGQREEVLAGIWQGLLRVPRVGRHDNFFELGGHSLLLVHMMEHLREAGFSTDVASVYGNPSLAGLAVVLTTGASPAELEAPPNGIPPGCTAITPPMLSLVELTQEQIQCVVRLVPGGAANIQDIYPLAPLQEGILFHHKLDERGGDTYALPLLLRLSSRQTLDSFICALQQVIDRHDILRTAVLSEELLRPVQVVYRRATLPVEELLLETDRPVSEQLKELMRPDVQKVDLRRAPLVRLKVAPDQQTSSWYALLQLHHVISDHESVETLLAEVKALVDRNELQLACSQNFQVVRYEFQPLFTRLAHTQRVVPDLMVVRDAGANLRLPASVSHIQKYLLNDRDALLIHGLNSFQNEW